MSYRVVIPTAGIGSRLEALTRYINKSLVSVANRPTLSHLIEQFPSDCEFVIALGYKGNLVRDFLELTYPHRTFFFVNVDEAGHCTTYYFRSSQLYIFRVDLVDSSYFRRCTVPPSTTSSSS